MSDEIDKYPLRYPFCKTSVRHGPGPDDLVDDAVLVDVRDYQILLKQNQILREGLIKIKDKHWKDYGDGCPHEEWAEETLAKADEVKK